MSSLVLKVTLTPALIGLVSLAGRRWGPAVSGWLVGLPFTSGPVALLLALDHGTTFAAAAAQGILAGAISGAAFCLAYSWAALVWSWLLALPLGFAAFGAATVVLQPITPPLPALFAGVVAALLLTLRLLPARPAAKLMALTPRWEIAARMLFATGLVLLITGLAPTLGPHLSGLLAPFPIYATILAVFTQRFAGPTAAANLLRGVVYGIFAAATFFLVLAALLSQLGIAPTFLLACLAALLVQGATLRLLHGRPKPSPSQAHAEL
jgi:hypothetical protein